MLSRVAERLYWMARYIERAENTARMVMAFSHLALDMPRAVQLSWKSMVSTTGGDEAFDHHYQRDDERNCVKFLLADLDNPSSIMTSLTGARENVRTTRDLVPSEAWESVNELYLFGKANAESGIGKRGRYAFLSEIISRCQQITGLLAGTMSHDFAYDFIRSGRNLERADMSSRLLDVAGIGLLSNDDDMQPFENLLWINILKSVSGFQMYRQHVRRRVNGALVIQFLLQDRQFPRAVAHALGEVETSLSTLPRNELPLRYIVQVKRHVQDAKVESLLKPDELHQFLDQIQKDMAETHASITENWFRLDRAA
ncbi:hypothetical protein B1C78_16385 [Thioalkalivibrio denitrificans]|uniref:DUF403 domain-containing protein n=1 Tax=Thioalkalivibrio denitrificans TaxID=108003 RepID=A0A1V3N981_9GAMM|nr:alpha-E domain-containing protein [Thioalkalivibrio denitrificans]OOG21372.1 hypothetical protein B1C78_16385 [Thioalkalivibrio denitrificans]